jgi:hypothetical protein
MPVSVNVYDHTRLRCFNGANAATDVYRCNLYSAFTFSASATTKSGAESGATQLSTANGYTQNTQQLTGVAINILSTNGATFTCSNIIWIATGGSIAASHAMIYNDTDANDPPLIHINFDGTITAASGQPFAITIPANGLLSALPA